MTAKIRIQCSKD